jgi:hypothetical protein
VFVFVATAVKSLSEALHLLTVPEATVALPHHAARK